MECTGERYLPEFDRDWTLEHRHRYLLACEIAAGKRVLDIACGDGYGSALLAEKAGNVIGVDIDLPTVERAREKYQKKNLSFLHGSAIAIPLEDNAVDLVISFETIEHLQEHDAMMCEIRRVLRRDGILLISSPDKFEYSDRPGYHNEYHVKELYFDEFKQLLAQYFTHSAFLGQKVVFGSIITAPGCAQFLSWYKNGSSMPVAGLSEAVYHIAIAGDGILPQLPGSLFQAPLEQSDKVLHLAHSLDVVQKDARNILTDLNLIKEERNLIKEELTAAHAELTSLLQSTSWKITAPLRMLRKLWSEFLSPRS